MVRKDFRSGSCLHVQYGGGISAHVKPLNEVFVTREEEVSRQSQKGSSESLVGQVSTLL